MKQTLIDFTRNAYMGSNSMRLFSGLIVLLIATSVFAIGGYLFLNQIGISLFQVFMSSGLGAVLLFACYDSVNCLWNPFRLGVTIGLFIMSIATLVLSSALLVLSVVLIFVSLLAWKYVLQDEGDKELVQAIKRKHARYAELQQEVSVLKSKG